MINNYAKYKAGCSRDDVFPFDDHDPAATEAAIAAALATGAGNRNAGVALYRQLTVPQEGVLCVGHAPIIGANVGPGRFEWRCANCKQRGVSG